MTYKNIYTRRTEWLRALWVANAFFRWAVYLALLAFAYFVVPTEAVRSFMMPGSDWTRELFDPICTYILMALGLNIVVGHAGLLDLGYVAFYAIGAYSVGYLGVKQHISFWEALILGVVFAAVAGIILGGPTLRLRGDYLAIVTLGFGEIIRIIALNTDEIGGAQGIFGIPHPPNMLGMEFGVLDTKPYYYLMLTMIVIAIIVSRRLERSRVGRAWSAIREDEDAAELMGVPTFKFKLLAFFIGAAVGGLGGAGVAGGPTGYIQPQNFLFILSATIVVCVIFGGAGNIPGVILGAFLVAWLPERFRNLQDYRMMAFGAVLVIMMILRPEGLLPSRRRRAELKEGSGGMGSMGAEVSTATTAGPAEVTK